MKFISIIFILLFSAPAAAGLYAETDPITGVYHIYGDMDNFSVVEQYKSQLPASVTPLWPKTNGVWILPAHIGVMKQPPTQLGPSLLPTDDVSAALTQYANSALVGGIPLPYVSNSDTFESLVLMFCDYKTNQQLMKCKMARTAAGEIEAPPPFEPTSSCSISGSIDLHHGNLTLETVANHSATTMAYVTCSRSTKVSMSIEGMVPLKGVTGLFSQLTVADAPLAQAYSFTADTSYTPVPIKSVLKTVGTVTPGDFSGSARVELTFP
ncbi:hypothetical protein [Pseudomonas fluorescens]|uniref:MrpH family fimbial adhesin n=1 Tax=Pseudomonas fluorescens TaxID=294 RepID=UPI0017823FA4|nr:hypothetical protein [Pseudomonas fluorescens]